MFYDKIEERAGGRIGEPEEVRGKHGDAGVPQAVEITVRAFSSSWQRVLVEKEVMCIVQQMLVQWEGGRAIVGWEGRGDRGLTKEDRKGDRQTDRMKEIEK